MIFMKKEIFYMESFGLLQILQNLLASASPSPAPAPTQEEETKPEPPTPQDEPTQNQRAILSFLESHDERAKRIKKP